MAAVGGIVATAVARVGPFISADAALAVAGEFGFPLALAVAVLGFLLVQHHLDRRDPKLQAAQPHLDETVIRFESEDSQ
jgi:hypothetical protein